MTDSRDINSKKAVMDSDNLVDASTGELVSSHLGVGRIHLRSEAQSAILSSDEYVIIDSQALTYVSKHFSPVDMGRILQISNMTYGMYNIIHLNRQPITEEQLMKTLNYSRNKYADFMKRLYQKSIIYYMSGVIDGKDRKYIMLNPYLARKRKTMDKDTLRVFENISKVNG